MQSRTPYDAPVLLAVKPVSRERAAYGAHVQAQLMRPARVRGEQYEAPAARALNDLIARAAGRAS